MLKRYTNGSWSEIKYKKYGNKAEEFAEFPVTIKNDGNDLTDYSISGNMTQSGTPTPTTPIQPQETGDRTGNLFDESTGQTGYFINSNGTLSGNQPAWIASDYVEISENTEYTFTPNSTAGAAAKHCFYDSNKQPFVSYIINSGQQTFTTPVGAKYARFSYRTSSSNVTLNLGSEALPYENFGYKIPITVKDFSFTILGVEQSTNYAYISKSDLPNASVGDYISTTIGGVDYSLAIMRIDDNYIYIENRTV